MKTGFCESIVAMACVFLGAICLLSCEKKSEPSYIPAGYQNWDRLTEAELNYPIPGHMNHFRIPYINDVGKRAAVTKKNGRMFHEYPEGTVIVKEIYEGPGRPKPSGHPKSLTVMIKNGEHPLSRGGWLWVMKDMAAGKETVVDYSLCIDCHANANEKHPYGDKNLNENFRDFVYFPPAGVLAKEKALAGPD